MKPHQKLHRARHMSVTDIINMIELSATQLPEDLTLVMSLPMLFEHLAEIGPRLSREELAKLISFVAIVTKFAAAHHQLCASPVKIAGGSIQ